MNTDKLTEEALRMEIEDLFEHHTDGAVGLCESIKEGVVKFIIQKHPSLPKETDAVEWISMKDNFMPLEKTVLISHKFGIDAIHFQQANWRYLYSGKIVARETLSMVTHFAVPSPPKP